MFNKSISNRLSIPLSKLNLATLNKNVLQQNGHPTCQKIELAKHGLELAKFDQPLATLMPLAICEPYHFFPLSPHHPAWTAPSSYPCTPFLRLSLPRLPPSAHARRHHGEEGTPRLRRHHSLTVVRRRSLASSTHVRCHRWERMPWLRRRRVECLSRQDGR